jgi:hypothetical protein
MQCLPDIQDIKPCAFNILKEPAVSICKKEERGSRLLRNPGT